MYRTTLVTLLSLAMLPLATNSASAHPAPYPHRHVRTQHVRRAPVVRHAPPRRKVVVVEQPVERVVVERPVVVHEETVVRESPMADMWPAFGIGVRVGGSTLSGSKFGLDAGENSVMGGMGLQLRTRITERVGLELSADFMGSDNGEFSQLTIPVMAGLSYHFLPRSRFQPYLVAGAGVHFNQLDYLGGRYAIDSAEAAGQLGGGFELFLTRDISLQADLRAQTVFKNIDTQARIREDCIRQVGDMQGFCDGIHSADPDDKVNLGVQFSGGVNFYF